MTAKTPLEKLRVLLPHWIDHSRSHQDEFKKWRDIVNHDGHAEIAELIAKAIESMAATDAFLEAALVRAGGNLTGHHHHHPHHHHDE